MRELSTIDKAALLIKAACGEYYGDCDIVMDLCAGYAEPGYGNEDSVVVFGNWNNKRWLQPGDKPLTKEGSLPSRLGDALERIGVECEWYDEWAQCENCYKAFRTQADSYSWRMYGSYIEGYVCVNCLLEDMESLVESLINNSDNALTFGTPANLTEIGFEKWEPNDPKTYENGFHPGQDDDPKTILAEILQWNQNAEVVFYISDVGQFDIRFSAFFRIGDSGENWMA